jgi:uncharacterized membrane protein SirB2
MIIIILLLIANTVCGTIWLVKFRNEHEEFLKTRYYVLSIILLSIPIGIAAFFVVIFLVVICMLYMDHRRMREHQRLDDEGLYDVE